MPSTYSALHVHAVFSTKDRAPWITEEIEDRLWKYMAAVALKHRMKPIRIGGIEDHIHVLVGIPATMAVSRAVQLLKGASSRWVHQTFPAMTYFAWQDGYGAFSVSQSALPSVAAYIARQREHHAKQSYESELRTLLAKHGLEVADDDG